MVPRTRPGQVRPSVVVLVTVTNVATNMINIASGIISDVIGVKVYMISGAIGLVAMVSSQRR